MTREEQENSFFEIVRISSLDRNLDKGVKGGGFSLDVVDGDTGRDWAGLGSRRVVLVLVRALSLDLLPSRKNWTDGEVVAETVMKSM